MQVTTDIDRNIDIMLSDIKKANKQQIDFLCFPECALSGYVVNHCIGIIRKYSHIDIRKQTIS
jgi:predicted amidohydrolase